MEGTSARVVHIGHFGDYDDGDGGVDDGDGGVDDGGGGVDDDEQDGVQSVFMLASEWFTLDTLDSCLLLSNNPTI